MPSGPKASHRRFSRPPDAPRSDVEKACCDWKGKHACPICCCDDEGNYSSSSSSSVGVKSKGKLQAAGDEGCGFRAAGNNCSSSSCIPTGTWMTSNACIDTPWDSHGGGQTSIPTFFLGLIAIVCIGYVMRLLWRWRLEMLTQLENRVEMIEEVFSQEEQLEADKSPLCEEDYSLKTLVSEELLNQMRENFQKYDLDGSGTINSRKELAQLVVNLYFALSARYGVEGPDLLSGSSGFPAFTAEELHIRIRTAGKDKQLQRKKWQFSEWSAWYIKAFPEIVMYDEHHLRCVNPLQGSAEDTEDPLPSPTAELDSPPLDSPLCSIDVLMSKESQGPDNDQGVSPEYDRGREHDQGLSPEEDQGRGLAFASEGGDNSTSPLVRHVEGDESSSTNETVSPGLTPGI